MTLKIMILRLILHSRITFTHIRQSRGVAKHPCSVVELYFFISIIYIIPLILAAINAPSALKGISPAFGIYSVT